MLGIILNYQGVTEMEKILEIATWAVPMIVVGLLFIRAYWLAFQTNKELMIAAWIAIAVAYLIGFPIAAFIHFQIGVLIATGCMLFHLGAFVITLLSSDWGNFFNLSTNTNDDIEPKHSPEPYRNGRPESQARAIGTYNPAKPNNWSV